MTHPHLKWPTWIGVVCEDLDAQRRFYRDVLGMNEVRAGDGYSWFELEGKVFELLAKSRLPQYDRRRVSVGFQVDDIHLSRQALLARGVVPVTGVEGGPDAGQYWAYFEDAEGNLFEIAQHLG